MARSQRNSGSESSSRDVVTTGVDDQGRELQRVFHPDLSVWQDVPAGKDSVQSWLDAGWEVKPGEHVRLDELPAMLQKADLTTEENPPA